MKSMLAWWAAGLIAALVLSAVSSQAAAPAALTTEQWRADLQFLARELPKRHPEPWRFTPQGKFDVAVAELDARLPRLNADEASVGLARIALLMGDGHTYVAFPDDNAPLPIVVNRFGADFRVVAADQAHAAALGARLVAIDGMPIDDAYERALTLAARDENPPLQEVQALGFLRLGMALHGLGVTRDRDRARFTLATDDGRRLDMDVAALASGEKPQLVSAAKSQTLARSHPGESFWCQAIEAAHTVYCDFRGYGDLGRGEREMVALIDATHPEKLVIDMRANGGGDYFVGLRYIVDPLASRPDLNRKGHLFVLIGPQTFSAAMSNAAHFRYRTQAILVGREIGEKPNSWQERRSVKLPNSGLQLNYSTKWYAFVPDGAENAIRPDHEVVPTWEDFVAGRDAALDWVLAYRAL